MKLSVVVSAESFRDRKNEVVIISPKKAYNICKLVGIVFVEHFIKMNASKMYYMVLNTRVYT